MPNVTSIASYSLTNLGPLTTVFTPAPSCSTVAYNGIAIGEFWPQDNDLDDEDAYPYGSSNASSTATSSTSSVFAVFGWDCASTGTSIGNCLPSGSVLDSAYASRETNADAYITELLPYYSPGIQCPSDWSTVGLATKFANGSTTASLDAFGLVDAATLSDSTTAYVAYQTEVLYNPMPNALLNALSPGETIVACCPSGYSADPYAVSGYCISQMPSSYPIPSSLCANFLYPEYTEASTTLVADGTTLTGEVPVEETIFSEVFSSTYGWGAFRPTDSAYAATLPPVAAATEQVVLYLVHQASDVSSAASRAVRSVGGGSVLAVGLTVAGAFVSGILLTVW